MDANPYNISDPITLQGSVGQVDEVDIGWVSNMCYGTQLYTAQSLISHSPPFKVHYILPASYLRSYNLCMGDTWCLIINVVMLIILLRTFIASNEIVKLQGKFFFLENIPDCCGVSNFSLEFDK